MSFWSLTLERVEQIKSQLKTKRDLLDATLKETVRDSWTSDLDQLKKLYDGYKVSNGSTPQKNRATPTITKMAVKKSENSSSNRVSESKNKKAVSEESKDESSDWSSLSSQQPRKQNKRKAIQKPRNPVKG